MTVSAAIRDVTARKAMEAEAKRAADRLASAVDTIQTPLPYSTTRTASYSATASTVGSSAMR